MSRATDARAVNFIQGAVVLAHSAGVSVVMEGMETPSQLEITVIAGADVVQGFLFAKLLSAKVAASLVEAAPQSRSRYVVQVSGIVRLEKLLSATT
jgi:EAL domain-containing protein (putative c-di-GMP-specific phosphodiesterase class I)